MKTSTEELKRLAEAGIVPANPAAVLDLIAEIERVTKQRDELLEALKEARELVEDWGAYAPAYMQEKHDLEGDMNKLDAAIANAEKQSWKPSSLFWPCC